jgi:prepilin-type N-terminal cleavage/methylation domain-containing protein/prepilin-type processing-associated H-X9-DG protein
VPATRQSKLFKSLAGELVRIPEVVMSGTKSLKRAFTLVELLVVIAIIGVLVALLLPAVQAARESARRTQCSNNLKQLGLGLTQYADTYRGVYPAGSYGCCWGTWQVALLPYIEQKALFDKYSGLGKFSDDNVRYGAGGNTQVTQQLIKAYTCPSDNKVAPHSNITFHNYVANHGNTALLRKTPYGVRSDGSPNNYKKAPFIAVSSATQNPQVTKASDISDGLSSTMAFSETIKGQNGDLRGFGWWQGGSHFEAYQAPNSNQPDVTEQDPYCVNQRPNPPCVGAQASGLPEGIAARSRHPGGVNVTFCDGAVKFMSDNVNLDTWRFLSTSEGREPANNLN